MGEDRRENRVARWAEHRYRVPNDVFQDFLRKHPEVDETQIRLVGAGLVEWFLIEQEPQAGRHVLPSLAVHRLIASLSADARYWRTCVERLSVSEPLDYVYPPRVGAQLLSTLQHAQQVEDTAAVPVLFDVDRACGITGGHRYTTTVAPDESHACGTDTLCIHIAHPFTREVRRGLETGPP